MTRIFFYNAQVIFVKHSLHRISIKERKGSMDTKINIYVFIYFPKTA